jgi:xanthine dehydrogenase accessory factor
VSSPRLVIIGSGHTAERLAELGGQLGYAEIRVTDAVPADLAAGDHVVVAEDDPRRGQAQLVAAARVAAARHAQVPAYLGFAATRAEGVKALVRLVAENVPQLRIDTICSPAGVDVGAETAAEVAISVAAELVAVRHGRARPTSHAAAPSGAGN